MEIYWDVLVFINFMVDFLLLLGTNRLSGHSIQPKRCGLGALIGAVYAGLCVLPGLSFLGQGMWHMAVLVAMALIAFGWKQDALRRGILFMLLSMALGGIASGLGTGGAVTLLLSAAGVCAMCLLGFRGRAGREAYVGVSVTHGEKRMELTALVDTGNTLRDPVSGDPVLILDADAASTLLGLSRHQLAHPVETLAAGRIPGLRLIPYAAVGQSMGMLLGLRVDALTVDGRQTKHIVAFAPQDLGRGKPYQALAGGMV